MYFKTCIRKYLVTNIFYEQFHSKIRKIGLKYTKIGLKYTRKGLYQINLNNHALITCHLCNF